MEKSELYYKLTGTETPKFLTEREEIMIEKFMSIINDQEEVKTDEVINELTDEQINDLMVTALEGGINYWCGKVTLKKGSLAPEQKYEYLSDCISLGGTLILHDAESDDTWELTKEKFLKGIEKTLVWGKNADVQDLFDNHDAEVADVLIQFSVFDEITFG